MLPRPRENWVDIRGSRKARRHSQKIAEKTDGIDLINVDVRIPRMQVNHFVQSVEIPSIKLSDFPGIKVPEKFENIFGLVVLPNISLADLHLPEFDGGLFCRMIQDANMDVGMIGNLQIPSLRFGDVFPNVNLSSILHALPNGFTVNGLRQYLNDIQLPAFRLCDVPRLELPHGKTNLPVSSAVFR